MEYARHHTDVEKPISISQKTREEEERRRLRVESEMARAETAEAQRARRLEANKQLKARFDYLSKHAKFDKQNARVSVDPVEFWAGKCRSELKGRERAVMVDLLSRSACVEAVLVIMTNNKEGISASDFQNIIFPKAGAGPNVAAWQKKCKSLIKSRDDYTVVMNALSERMTLGLLIHMINCGAPKSKFKKISSAI